jgi:tRNA(Ile)-lysidine synthase TilS/MesJ
VARRPKRDPAALVRTLCERISEGELVAQVIADLGISRNDVWRWTEADAALRDAYARAREQQAHAVAEQALVAAHGLDDYAQAVRVVLEREEARLDGMEGKEYAAHQAFVNSLRHAAVTRDKLRVDTLKWTASKLAPRDFGERQAVEVTGKDGAPLPAPVLYMPQNGRDAGT